MAASGVDGVRGVRVSRRGDGRWRVRWNEHGRERERSFAADAEQAAVAFAEELQRPQPGPDLSGPAVDGGVVWGQVWRRWMSARRVSWSPAIAQQNAQVLAKWAAPSLEHVPIRAVTAEHYQQIFATMIEHDRRGSVPRVRSLLAQLEQWAIDNDLRPARRFPVRAPAALAGTRTHGAKPEYVPPRMRPDTARVKVLGEAMVAVDHNGAWWRALQTDVAALCGLRLGETFALRSCHVDVDTRKVEVNWQYATEPGVQAVLKAPKSGKRRTAILLPEMVEAVARRLDEIPGEQVSPACADCADPGCGLLFPAPYGGPHNRSHFGKRARAGFEHTWQQPDPSLRWPRDPRGRWLWSWRELRHHAAVVLLDRYQLPPAEAAMLLGHTEHILLARYYGPQLDAIERALQATA